MQNKEDQIRNLVNKVHLGGILAELNPVKTGKTKDGVDYLSFSGAIQCGEEPVYTRRFKSFIKAKKSDGSDSENFNKVSEWLKNAVPLTKNKENPTYVDMVGSLCTNDYVSADNSLKEGDIFNIQFFNDFKGYCCDLDIEGYIQTIIDEEKKIDGESVETGRKVIKLVSTDIYKQTLIFKNIIVPKEFANELDSNGYEKGKTCYFYISWKKGVTVEKPAGIGEVRTEGKSYLEMVMTGAKLPYQEDSDKSLTVEQVKNLLKERKIKLDELKENGYQGSKNNKNNSSNTNNNRNSFGTKETSEKDVFAEVDDDEDFPF